MRPDKFNEKCAVFGIWGDKKDAARQTYFGLFALQHRGQENSGIASTDGKKIFSYKSSGLVSQVYSEKILHGLPGFAAIGHNRYSTSRGLGLKYAQPVTINGSLALAHNGNLPSTKALLEFLKDKTKGKNGHENKTLDGCSDSALMARAISVYLKEGMSLGMSVEKCYPLFTGSFSCVALSKNSLVAFRDPRGIRPLVLGKIEKGNRKIYCVASETCALRTVGATFVRDINPGEILVINKYGLKSKNLSTVEPKFDIFEFIYFSRHDSVNLGKLVYEVRKNLGRILAQESQKKVDVVVPVPETGIPIAIGLAQELGVPFEVGLMKNRYIHRTFIEPKQKDRDEKVKMKLIPLQEVISGKRVAVVDDSIVRGTTSRQIVKMLFEAGAKEVHFMVGSAQIRFPDFYGIDTPRQKDLIAFQKNTEEIREYLKATSLSFLSIDGMVRATGLPKERFSLSAFDGVYPLPIFEREREISYNASKE